MKKIIILILFTICLVFGISAFAACNGNVNNVDKRYNENITFKLSYTSEEECPNGNISDDKLHFDLDFEADKVYYLVLDFTVSTFPENWEILQAIVEFDPAEYITARLEEAATGSIGEREENGEKIITARYSIPEQRNEPKNYRVIYKFSGEQNLPEGGMSFNIGIAFITTANAAPEFQYLSFNYTEGLEYSFDEETLAYTVTGFQYGESCSNLVIPKNHDGKLVASIKSSAFHDCTSLTSITICNGVTSIGDYAFAGCSSLTNITIPSSITFIGERAFYNCTKLESITIPDSVTSIGGGAFEDTAYYNNPDNWTNDVLYIGNFLIDAKDTLSGSYEINQSTKLIADYAFKGCRITSITIPDSVTSIGGNAFYGCTSLESITIPDGVNSIGDGAFKNTAYYNNPDKWTNDILYIGNYLVGAKETISGSCEIENGTKLIADSVFYNCRIKSITIPNSVTSIGNGAFKNCNLTSIAIPNSVTSIGDSAFADCEWLRFITIGNGVKAMGYRAFSCCANLTSITISNGVTSIGSEAFNYCTSLTSVSIPDSVTSIGFGAFYCCEQLKNVTIGNSVIFIGELAFAYCTSLTSVIFVNQRGWKVFEGSNRSTIQDITLGTPAQNAKYLTDTYWFYYWKRA